MRRYGLSPVNNPISTLVYHAHAKDVDMVMVDGEVVVESGVVLAADEDVLVSNAAQAAEAAWQRFTERFGE
jgi:cytosine/adenosine deaminase-related metal-dependent hydrolase